MKYVTIGMIAAHAKKHRNTVVRALKMAGVKIERMPGVKGGRIAERDANKFLLRQWPGVGPFPISNLERS